MVATPHTMLPEHLLFQFERRDSKIEVAPPAHCTILAVFLPACSFLLFWYRSLLQSRQDSVFLLGDLDSDFTFTVDQVSRDLLER